VSRRIEPLAHEAEPATALPQRIGSIERIVVGKQIRLAGLIDQWVDADELISRRIVVAVDAAF
jgi:hypothetical protein